MKQFNITAQVYNLSDKDKQTILTNRVIKAPSEEKASEDFYNCCDNINHAVVQIYSVEEIPQTAH